MQRDFKEIKINGKRSLGSMFAHLGALQNCAYFFFLYLLYFRYSKE